MIRVQAAIATYWDRPAGRSPTQSFGLGGPVTPRKNRERQLAMSAGCTTTRFGTAFSSLPQPD